MCVYIFSVQHLRCNREAQSASPTNMERGGPEDKTGDQWTKEGLLVRGEGIGLALVTWTRPPRTDTSTGILYVWLQIPYAFFHYGKSLCRLVLVAPLSKDPRISCMKPPCQSGVLSSRHDLIFSLSFHTLSYLFLLEATGKDPVFYFVRFGRSCLPGTAERQQRAESSE